MRRFVIGVLLMALTPVAFANRVGTLIIAGGSSNVASLGNVSTNLIAEDGDWLDVLTATDVTVPHADGVRSAAIRCPRGTWVDDSGNEWANHCNKNGERVPVPGPFHAKTVATARGQGARLVDSYGAFLAGLNALGWATSSYNNGTPNIVAPAGDNALSNWEANPLTQTGYPTITNVNDAAYVAALYDAELENGCTEFQFDGNGQDRSTGMLSNWLYPRLAAVTPGFNEYARWVASEANCLRETAAWQAAYSFCATSTAFNARVGDLNYLQPSEMAHLPCVFIQSPNLSGWNAAMLLAPTYRVRVKWPLMKANVGAARMAQLLAAGEGAEQPASDTTTRRAWPGGRGAVVGRHR